MKRPPQRMNGSTLRRLPKRRALARSSGISTGRWPFPALGARQEVRGTGLLFQEGCGARESGPNPIPGGAGFSEPTGMLR